jgi:hypothetical protein
MEPAHSETGDCRVEPPASILVARLSMSHSVPLLEFNRDEVLAFLVTGIPAVKLQRFAAEARVLNVARMKELTEEKRFALAAALLFRQLARAYDDAADMLIRQVQRIHYKAKELMDIRQASHLQQSAELVSTLRNITIAFQQEGVTTRKCQNCPVQEYPSE